MQTNIVARFAVSRGPLARTTIKAIPSDNGTAGPPNTFIT